MICLLSLLSYYVFKNDPPVIYAYANNGGSYPDFTQLITAVSGLGNKLLFARTQIGTPLRKSSCLSSIGKTFYVYQNHSILDLMKIEGAIIKSNVTSDEVCNLASSNTYDAIIFAEGDLVYPKVGYSNPFTPGVWNCFFMIILCIAFIIWSMIHYSNIAVQENFAKKIN